METHRQPLQKSLLSLESPDKTGTADKRWKLIINETQESDLSPAELTHILDVADQLLSLIHILHAAMLAKQGIISEKDCEDILNGCLLYTSKCV